MTEYTKNQMVPAYNKTVTSHYTCDLCGESNEQCYNSGGGSWASGSSYDINKTTIEHESGTHYPGDYNTTKVKFHICPNCFEFKLTPWLLSRSANPTIEEIEG